MSRSKRIVHLAAAAAALGLTTALHAAPFTWDGGSATTNNWGDAANWTTSNPPNDGTANIFFAGTLRPLPNLEVPYSVADLTFNAGSAAFTIGGSALSVGAGGITHNDDSLQIFNTAIVLGASQSWSSASGSL